MSKDAQHPIREVRVVLELLMVDPPLQVPPGKEPLPQRVLRPRVSRAGSSDQTEKPRFSVNEISTSRDLALRGLVQCIPTKAP